MKKRNDKASAVNQRKKFITAVLVIAIAIASIPLVYGFVYRSFIIYDVSTTKITLKVENTNMIGVNKDTDHLKFGGIPRGAMGERRINVTNNDEKPHKINIKVRGNLSSWISSSDNDFVLQPHSVKEVKIYADIPLDAELGKYEGELDVIFENILW